MILCVFFCTLRFLVIMCIKSFTALEDQLFFVGVIELQIFFIMLVKNYGRCIVIIAKCW